MAQPKITREQIIQQALITLGNKDSFEKFSLRQVAADMNIDVSTLYWYFKNKQDILQAMAQAIISQVAWPDTNLEWHEQLRQAFNNIFDVYLKYPLSAILMIETIPSSEVRLKLIDHLISIPVKAGIDKTTAVSAITSLDFLLSGSLIDLTTENRLRRQVIDEQDQDLAQHVRKIRQITEQQHLQYMQDSMQIRRHFTAKQQFNQGLELIIDGLRQHIN